MEAKEVILRSLEQSQGYLNEALEGLTQQEAGWSPEAGCNSIAFILWHTARVEDYFVHRVVRRENEIYEAEGWREKLGTPAKDTGWEYNTEQVEGWPVPDIKVLRGYADSVREKTLAFLHSIPDEKLSEVPRPDRSPNSIGVTLGTISTEIALHVGQIHYLSGVQRGLGK